MGTTVFVAYKWDAINYLKYKFKESDFIENEYVYPEQTTINAPEKKRNLIYIYLESMETTYTEKKYGGAAEVNYIPELTDLALQNECFSGEENVINGACSLYGSTWTIGGIFAQTAGVPLELPFNTNAIHTQTHFMDSMVVLGDILNAYGYQQMFMVGSDSEFGGRRSYYEIHGEQEVYDYNSALEDGSIPEGYKVFWGYEDKVLFSNAQREVLKLSKGGEPFCFTMLTVDTHFEDGYLCEDCNSEFGDNRYANAIRCSSNKVSEFINWIKEQDFYDNTTIIVCGDHPTMDSDFCDYVDEAYERRVYTCIINSGTDKKIMDTREYSTFDLFPTTLEALGFDIDGHKLGIGVSLYSDEMTLLEQYEKENLERKLASSAQFVSGFNETDNLPISNVYLVSENDDNPMQHKKKAKALGDWKYQVKLPEGENFLIIIKLKGQEDLYGIGYMWLQIENEKVNVHYTWE